MTVEHLFQTISAILAALAVGIIIYGFRHTRTLEPSQTHILKMPINRTRLARLSFTYTTIILILGAGVIWILNLTNIIQGNWSSPFSASLITLSVLFAFVTWACPLPPIPPNSKGHSTDDRVYEVYCNEVRAELKGKPKKGAVIVRASKELLGKTVWIGWQRTVVGLQTRNSRDIYVASLTNLKYNDNYKVSTKRRKSRWVPVRRGQVAEVDWRFDAPL